MNSVNRGIVNIPAISRTIIVPITGNVDVGIAPKINRSRTTENLTEGYSIPTPVCLPFTNTVGSLHSLQTLKSKSKGYYVKSDLLMRASLPSLQIHPLESSC